MFRAIGFLILAVAPVTYAQLSPPIPPGSMRPDGAYQVGNGVSPPSQMYRTSCEIPELARKIRAQGEVTLSLVVKADGSVRDVEIVQSAGYGMDERAAESILKWRFKPGAKDGSPRRCGLSLRIQFWSDPTAPTMGRRPGDVC